MSQTSPEQPGQDGPRLRMWRIGVAPKSEEFDRWNHPDRREYYIAAASLDEANEAAIEKYRGELELLTSFAEIEPIVVERIGPALVQRWGMDRPTGWWRRLFR